MACSGNCIWYMHRATSKAKSSVSPMSSVCCRQHSKPRVAAMRSVARASSSRSCHDHKPNMSKGVNRNHETGTAVLWLPYRQQAVDTVRHSCGIPRCGPQQGQVLVQRVLGIAVGYYVV